MYFIKQIREIWYVREQMQKRNSQQVIHLSSFSKRS